MKVFLFYIVLFGTVTLVYSQEQQFVDGYVVTRAKDTIYGKVKDRKLGRSNLLTNKITIRFDDGRSKKFRKEKVISYKRGSEVFVRTKIIEQIPLLGKIDNEYFLVKIISGPHELYKHYFNEQDRGTIEDVYLIRSIGNNIYVRLPALMFRRTLKKYFGVNSSISKKLENRKYNYRDIPMLIRELSE